MTERLTTKELAAIKERAEKATVGPWIFEEGNRERGDRRPAVVCHFDYDDGEWYIHGDISDKADADFIANARQDIPKLIAEVERLKHYEEKCGKLLEALRYMPCDIDDIVGGNA